MGILKSKVQKELLYKKDVAEMIGRTVRTVELWMKDGTLPPCRYVKGKATWTRGQFNHWLANRGQTCPSDKLHRPTSA